MSIVQSANDFGGNPPQSFQIATFNPVTYLLEGLRSLAIEGWTLDVVWALAAIAAVGAISMSMCMAALRSRVKTG